MPNCTTTNRLLFAKNKGLIDNFSVETCALGFYDFKCFENLGMLKFTICNPEKSVVQKAFELNYLTFVDSDGIKRNRKKKFDNTFVNIKHSGPYHWNH